MTQSKQAPGQDASERVDDFFRRTLRTETLRASPAGADAKVNVPVSEIAQLKDDLESLLRAEGRRSAVVGLLQNTVFFVLGLAVTWVPSAWIDQAVEVVRMLTQRFH